jgi:hypothetical protein
MKMLRLAAYRTAVSGTARRLMCTKGNVVLPKEEFAGKTEMAVQHQVNLRADAAACHIFFYKAE